MFRVIELQPEGQLFHGGVEFTFRNCKRGGVVRAGIVSISSEEGAVRRILLLLALCLVGTSVWAGDEADAKARAKHPDRVLYEQRESGERGRCQVSR